MSGLDELEQRLLAAQGGQPPSVFTEDRANRPEVIFEPESGGRVERNRDGTLSFVGPNWSTGDQEAVQRILNGEDPNAVLRGHINEGFIQENPILSRAVSMFTGVPGAGSWLDEAVGATFGDQAEAGVNTLRTAMEENRPGQHLGLQIGGGLLAGLPLAAAGIPADWSNMSRGARMLLGGVAGGVGGATEGAIYGSGMQQGQGRRDNALSGGLLGGTLGAGIGTAIPAIQDGVVALWQSLRGSPINEVADRLGTSPQVARLFANYMEAGDPDRAIAALSGNNRFAYAMPEMADAVAANGGAPMRQVRNAIDEDILARNSALTGTMDDIMGAPQGQTAAITDIRTASQPARSSAYNAAYSQPIDFASDQGQELLATLERVPAAAWRQARSLMELDGDRTLQRLVEIAEDGTVTLRELPDVRTLDYLTRALGDVADRENAQGLLGGTTQLGRSTGNLRQTIRQQLGDLVPEYRIALDTAADAIGQAQGVRTGYGLLGMRRDEAAEALAGMSAAERRAAMQGARSYLDDQIARVRAIASDPGPDAMEARQALQTLRELSSGQARENITALIGEDEAARLFAELGSLTDSLNMRANIARNSQTYVRGAINRDIDSAAGPAFVERATDGADPMRAAGQVLQVLTGDLDAMSGTRRMQFLQEIADALTNIRGEEARALARQIAALGADGVMDPRAARRVQQLIGEGAGLLSYLGAQQSLAR